MDLISAFNFVGHPQRKEAIRTPRGKWNHTTEIAKKKSADRN
jgi:hypothetical protein